MAYDVQDFQREVIEESRHLPVVVDFWADWCAPCRVLGPVLEGLAEEAGGRWRLAKVDTETFPEEAARYGVRGIPNVKLFVDGRPVDEFVGALPEGDVRRWLERALPSDADREGQAALREARERLFREPGAALALLEGLDPPGGDREAVEDMQLLGRLLLRLDDPRGLEGSEAGRLYLEAIRHLQEEDFDRAAAAFIDVLRLDRTLDDEGARRAVAALFRHLGPDHPVVRARRSEFAGALYV